ncbi:hypothetical protein [Streptomyces sp. NBC_01217]|uniref:hypothetical protein n=1 Tax=Streptomyces sp. NBC_01217 TaxID=2903779 RepID=UPI002E15BC51|nr:hypothetical protein OG507_14285 [Streptomyces sp. NBC_01217]
MQRGLVHALAWSLATGAAVTLSWWGVHTVMAGTAYDPPRAVPISAGARGDQGPSDGLSSSTRRPEPTPPPSPSATAPPPPTTPKPSASTPPSRQPSRTPQNNSPSPAGSTPRQGTVKSYGTDGGRVVFELGKDWAKLVSATPAPDWSMQVWTNSTWIRVNFSQDNGTTVSVFCTWNDHPPQVEIV